MIIMIAEMVGIVATQKTTPRQTLILRHLRSSGRMDVNQLARLCQCSPITVRRALQALESRNLVVRTPGGAMPVDQVAIEVSFPERLTINTEQKHRIAQSAAELVEDGAVLLLDNGSSVYLLAEYLSDRNNLTIITFFLPLMNKLPQRCDWKIILAGGQLRNGRGDLVGPLTEEFLSKIYADIAFFGADGLDEATGVWTVDPESARLTEVMCNSSAQKILLADSSKLHRRAAFAAVRWECIDRWITDSGADADVMKTISDKGVKVELV